MGVGLRLGWTRVRQHRRSTVGLALLVAIAVGVVLAAFAGARRTDAAVPAMVKAHRSGDMFVSFIPPVFGGEASPDLAPETAAVKATPGVRDAKPFTNGIITITPRAPGATPTSGAPTTKQTKYVLAYISIRPGATAMVGHPYVLAGHLPNEAKAGEVAIDEELARDTHLHVGSPVALHAFTFEQADEILQPKAQPAGLALDGRVTAIVRHPYDLRDLRSSAADAAINLYATHYDMYVTSAFWHRADGDIFGYNPSIGVTLDRARGATVASVSKALRSSLTITHDTFPANSLLAGAGTLQGATRAASLQSRALQAFGGLAALVALFLVGQALGRQIRLESNDESILRAIGMTPAQLRLADVIRSSVVALAGATLGIAVALALSPLAPLPGSTARRALRHPGWATDWTVVLPGAVAAVLLVVLVALALGRWRRLTTARAQRGSRLAGRLAAWGLTAPRAVGVSFALESGQGRRSVPVRAALVAGAAAVTSVLGLAVVASSLTAMRHDPHSYGVTWDAAVGGSASLDESNADLAKVRAIPGVTHYSGANVAGLVINSQETAGLITLPKKGRVTPLVVEGRAPTRDNEIALGRDTMRKAKTAIGRTVEVSAVNNPPVPFRVVGRVVLNSAGIDKTVSLGSGALLDWSAYPRLLPPDLASTQAPQSWLLQVAPGAQGATARRRLRQAFSISYTSAVEPADVETLGEVAGLPAALALVLALLGIATVIHALLTAVYRRGRDLAVLKTLGFERRHVRRVITSQATTFAVVSLLVGLPLGLLAGRWSWSLIANQIGVVSHMSVPLLAALAGCLALWIVALTTALVPARLAARVSVATSLRQE